MEQSITRQLVVESLILIPGSAQGQTAADLVRFAFDQALASDYEGRPPWACLLVKPDEESEARDPLPSEMPDSNEVAVKIAGASECLEAPGGASHRASGEQAVMYKIGVGEILDSGQAWFTTGWYRGGTNAGASRCHATLDGDAWILGECQLLWIS